ncbi:MAG: nicotinate-nucleotide adenylyltransferase [Sulfuritalea sp.]|nr:nicotinate-nucleotide adenylyltransferase [Sulfuritalea sp.]
MSSTGDGVLGLLGGTFDPLHIAHLRLAQEAREALRLAEVCLVPAGNPPLRDTPQCSGAHRLAMVERALAAAPGFSIDASEVLNSAEKPVPSYTVDTLERQRLLQGPARPLVLILGADAFARLEAWHRWRDVFELAHIAVATRPGHELKVGSGDTAPDPEFATRQSEAGALAKAAAGKVVSFSITALEISATEIRRRLAEGLSVRYLVPDTVLDYIESQQIYRTPHGH